MIRIGLAHAQGHDQDVFGYDCNRLSCGKILGVPIKFSIYLVFFLLYSFSGFAGVKAPWWFFLGLALGSFLLLLLTILVHEFGHGLTAKSFGGNILYILLWPLGGLCVHTMPESRTVQEKLSNDWWVTVNGPLTHLFMLPLWLVLLYLLRISCDIPCSGLDLLSELNPFTAPGLAASPSEADHRGWGITLLLHLCSTAINLNVVLFLFNVLVPMYPMDSSKLLCTGMQLCGTPVQVAAQRFIWISGASAVIMAALSVYNVVFWSSHAGPDDMKHVIDAIAFGMIPIPLSVVGAMGLAAWGGKQTWDLKKLAENRQLHTHPLFCHMPHVTRTVRDVAGGRPDRFVELSQDAYEDSPAPVARNYGSARVVGGQVLRERPQAPDALPRQEIVMR